MHDSPVTFLTVLLCELVDEGRQVCVERSSFLTASKPWGAFRGATDTHFVLALPFTGSFKCLT